MITSNHGFSERIKDIELGIEEIEQKLFSLHQQKKGLLEEFYKLKKVESISSRVQSYFTWIHKHEAGTLHTAWFEHWQFKLIGSDFYICLKENMEKKRDKWEVIITGQTITSYAKNESNLTYLKERYPSCKLKQKFKSESQAREFINAWQDKLERDHEEEISKQQLLLAQVRS